MWLAIFVVVALLVVLLTPPPDMPGAEKPSMSDFNMVTATSDRIVPECFGTVKLSPNLIKFSDYVAEPIDISQGKTSTTVGYAIYASAQFVLAKRIDYIKGVFIDDNYVSSYSYKFYATNPLDSEISFSLMTGKKSQMYPSNAYPSTLYIGSGYFQSDTFKYSFNDGIDTYEISSKLAQIRTIKMFLGDNAQSMPNYAFVVTRNNLLTQTEIDNKYGFNNYALGEYNGNYNNGDVNPFDVLRYIFKEYLNEELSNDNYLYQKLENENFWISFVMTNEHTAEDWIKELLRHLDANLEYYNNTWKVNLIRNDYLDVDGNETRFINSFNEDNYKNFNFKRKTWEDVKTDIIFKYTDPVSFKTSVLNFSNEAAKLRTDKTNVGTYSFNMIRNDDLAKKVMDRVIKKECYPLATIKFSISTDYINDRTKVGSENVKIKVGSVIKISNIKMELNNIYYRVTKISAGKEADDSFEIEAIEDIFAINDFDYTKVQSKVSFLDNYTLSDINANDLFIIDAPAELVEVGTDAVIPIMVKQTDENVIGYNVRDGLSGNKARFNYFYDVGTLETVIEDSSVTNIYNDTYTYIISNYTGSARSSVEQGFQRLKFSIVFDDGELSTFKTISDNGDGTWTVTGIIRSLNNTNGNAKIIGSKVYFSQVEAADNQYLSIAGSTNKTFYFEKFNSYNISNYLSVNYTYNFTSRKPYRLELKSSTLINTDTQVYLEWYESKRLSGANYRPTDMVIPGESEGLIEEGRYFEIEVNGVFYNTNNTYITLDRTTIQTYYIRMILNGFKSDDLIITI